MFKAEILRTVLHKSELSETFIQNIYDERPADFWFKLSSREILYISCEHQFPFLAIAPSKDKLDRPSFPSPFCQFLRQHLRGSRIVTAKQPEGEKILTLTVTRYDDKAEEVLTLRMIAELIPHRANLIVTDEEGVILGLLNEREEKDRTLKEEELYIPPPPRLGVEIKDEVLDRSLEDIWKNFRSEQIRRWIEAELRDKLSGLRSRRKKLKRLIKKVGGDLARAERAPQFKKKGELLKANLHRVKRGMEEVKVTDFYDEDSPEITISLDPQLSPPENMEKIFQRYKKLLRAQEKVEKRKKNLEEELAEIEEKLEYWDSASQEELRARLDLSPSVEDFPGHEKKKKKRESRKFHRFTSLDDWRIYVARDKDENEELTLRRAQGKDYFFHVQEFPGSHVVAFNESKKDHVPLETLLDAATLAVHYSKLRGADKAEVKYTQCKNLRKPKGMARGKVLVDRYQCIMVEMEEDRLERLLDGKD